MLPNQNPEQIARYEIDAMIVKAELITGGF